MRVNDDEYYALLTEGRAPSTFQAGELVFEQGDRGDAMYVVRAGSVELRDGEQLIETVTAPGLFGEMALIEDEPRALSAVAAGDAVLVEIPARHFWILVHDTPYFAQLVMSVMARRLRHTRTTT
jgi:CRP/FNR family transcriptional regulator, cyclic AMP receptor protein